MSFGLRVVARLLSVIVVAIGVPTALSGVASAVPTDPVAYCSARAENPHVSSTPGAGIDAKTAFYCTSGAGASMTVHDYLMNLYLCPQPVSGPESGWTTTQGCVVKSSSASATYHDGNFSLVTGQTVKRQVPHPGQPAVHGSGYWVTCTQYTRTGLTGTQRVASASVQLTG